LTGQFASIDLGRLVHERFAQHLTGMGQVAVERARFDAGRLEEARGSLAMGPGTVGRGLLDAAVEQMRLVPNGPPVENGDPIAYGRLAANWRLDGGGLRLEGWCLELGPGTVLAGTGSWSIGEPANQPLPLAALVRTLVPGGTPEVPATPRAEWLLRHLPFSDPAHAADRRAAEQRR